MKKIHKERQIYALLDGRLDVRKLESLEKHLAGCEDCREFMQRARVLRRELKGMGESLPETVDWDALETRIEREARKQAAPVRQPEAWVFFWKLSLTSAALLLLFALYLVVEKYRGGEEKEGPKSRQGQTASVQEEPGKPLPGVVTFTSTGVLAAAPGGSPGTMGIETVMAEGSRVETRAGSSAGIQVGHVAGVRVESDSGVTFARLTDEEIVLRLDRGSISVDYMPEGGKARLSVLTSEARVTVKGTLFSVSKQSDHTSVVVGRGVVEVAPEKGKQGRVSVRRSEGVRVSRDGLISSIEPSSVAPEQERLDTVLFNFFKERIPDETLVLDVKDNGDFAFLDLGGKKESSGQIVMRSAPGEGTATVILKNGGEIPLGFAVAEGKGGSVTYDLSTIASAAEPKKQVKAAPPEEKPVKKGKEGPVQEEETGYIDPFIIRMKILKQKGPMRACYEKYLALGPKEGIVKARIAFTIGNSGKVVEASCSANVENGELKSCLTSVIESIVFPAPDGGPVKFEYPVTFTSK
jgi:anti-sigma factor RsiW